MHLLLLHTPEPGFLYSSACHPAPESCFISQPLLPSHLLAVTLASNPLLEKLSLLDTVSAKLPLESVKCGENEREPGVEGWC